MLELSRYEHTVHRIKQTPSNTYVFRLTHEKEVKGNVAIITTMCNSSRCSWPRSHCVLPVVSAVDCRAYARVITVKTDILRKKSSAVGATIHGGELRSIPSGKLFYNGLIF